MGITVPETLEDKGSNNIIRATVSDTWCSSQPLAVIPYKALCDLPPATVTYEIQLRSEIPLLAS